MNRYEAGSIRFRSCGLDSASSYSYPKPPDQDLTDRITHAKAIPLIHLQPLDEDPTTHTWLPWDLIVTVEYDPTARAASSSFLWQWPTTAAPALRPNLAGAAHPAITRPNPKLNWYRVKGKVAWTRWTGTHRRWRTVEVGPRWAADWRGRRTPIRASLML
jgi:hypothetical protein